MSEGTSTYYWFLCESRMILVALVVLRRSQFSKTEPACNVTSSSRSRTNAAAISNFVFFKQKQQHPGKRGHRARAARKKVLFEAHLVTSSCRGAGFNNRNHYSCAKIAILEKWDILTSQCGWALEQVSGIFLRSIKLLGKFSARSKCKNTIVCIYSFFAPWGLRVSSENCQTHGCAVSGNLSANNKHTKPKNWMFIVVCTGWKYSTVPLAFVVLLEEAISKKKKWICYFDDRQLCSYKKFDSLVVVDKNRRRSM